MGHLPPSEAGQSTVHSVSVETHPFRTLRSLGFPERAPVEAAGVRYPNPLIILLLAGLTRFSRPGKRRF